MNAELLPPDRSSDAVQILVVDDDRMARMLFENALKLMGYKVSLAANAAEARKTLSELGAQCFECIIVDHQMPGETGLQLLEWLRGSDPTLAIIMISAAPERDLMAMFLRAGAANFLDKPFKRRDLENSVMAAVANTRRRRQLARVEAEAAAVGRVQRRLLGHGTGSLPGNVEFRHQPMSGAGGDFLNAYQLDADRLLVLIADVSGHDLKAAYASAYFQGLVRGLLEKPVPIDQILAFFNACLLREWTDNPDDQIEVPTSMAVCAVVVDNRGRSVQLFNAGGPVPCFVGLDGSITPCGTRGGNPLGWFEDSPPEPAHFSFPSPGWLVMWTDGLEEHASGLGVNLWSLAYAMLQPRGIFWARSFLANLPDDILLSRVPIGIDETIPAKTVVPILYERYPGAGAARIDEFQTVWNRSLQLAIPTMDEDRLHEALVCLREATLNALLHGCQSAPDRFAVLQILYHPEERFIQARIDDPGSGHSFDWNKHDSDAMEKLIPKHRGLILIDRFSKAMRLENSGASIEIDMNCD